MRYRRKCVKDWFGWALFYGLLALGYYIFSSGANEIDFHSRLLDHSKECPVCRRAGKPMLAAQVESQ